MHRRLYNAKAKELSSVPILPAQKCILYTFDVTGVGIFLATQDFLCLRLTDGELQHKGRNIEWSCVLAIRHARPEEIEIVTKEERIVMYSVPEAEMRVVELIAVWTESLDAHGLKSNMLTPNEAAQMLNNFDNLDMGRHRFLTREEFLRPLLPVFQYCGLPDSLFNAFDRNGDGVISQCEYMDGMRVLLVGTINERVEFAFRVFDTDRDGSIQMIEFEHVIRNLAFLTQYELPEDEAGFTTFCSRLYRNFRVEKSDHGLTIERFRKRILNGISKNIQGCQLLHFEKNAQRNVQGIGVVPGDPQWPLVSMILIGLKMVSTSRRLDAHRAKSVMSALDHLLTPMNTFFNPVSNNVSSGINSILRSGIVSKFRNGVGAIQNGVVNPIHHTVVSPLRGSLREGVFSSFQETLQHELVQPLQYNIWTPIKNEILTPFRGLGAETRRTYRFLGQEDPITRERQEVSLTEFADSLFSQIRNFYGFTEEAYQHSLGMESLVSGMVFGTLSAPRRMSSSGKSGSFFFLTHDERIILKTIHKKEAHTLSCMLEHYKDHLLRTGNSLLTVYLGLYEISFAETRVLFVAMVNVFPPSIVLRQQYDLKGSTAGRTVSIEERTHSSVALKDLDFQKKQKFLLISEQWQNDLFEQIQADATFLQSVGLNDYSLLLGIGAANSRQILIHQGENQAQRRFYYGIPSDNNKHVYFVGIIDILTSYEGIKVLEHAVKSVYQKNFSCIPPLDYAKRFVSFMDSVLCSRKIERVYLASTNSWATFETITTATNRIVSPNDYPEPNNEEEEDDRMSTPVLDPISPVPGPEINYGWLDALKRADSDFGQSNNTNQNLQTNDITTPVSNTTDISIDAPTQHQTTSWVTPCPSHDEVSLDDSLNDPTTSIQCSPELSPQNRHSPITPILLENT